MHKPKLTNTPSDASAVNAPERIYIRKDDWEYYENPDLIGAIPYIRADLAQPQWLPIETGPDLDRVMVAGWQAPSGSLRGYWWYHEDVIVDGKGSEHPGATHWAPLVIPSFPPAPEEAGG